MSKAADFNSVIENCDRHVSAGIGVISVNDGIENHLAGECR
jgi:hypothetical protein